MLCCFLDASTLSLKRTRLCYQENFMRQFSIFEDLYFTLFQQTCTRHSFRSEGCWYHNNRTTNYLNELTLEIIGGHLNPIKSRSVVFLFTATGFYRTWENGLARRKHEALFHFKSFNNLRYFHLSVDFSQHWDTFYS